LSLLSLLNICLVYLVVKITKHAKLVHIYILYYEVLETSYINLILNRVEFFFSQVLLFRKQIFSSIIFKIFASSICRLNATAKREQISCYIKMHLCNLYFDQDIKCLIIKKFSCYIELDWSLGQIMISLLWFDSTPRSSRNNFLESNRSK